MSLGGAGSRWSSISERMAAVYIAAEPAGQIWLSGVGMRVQC